MFRSRPCILTAEHVATKKDDSDASGDRRFSSFAHSVAEGSPPALILSRYLSIPEPRDLAFALADRERLASLPCDARPISAEDIIPEPPDGDFLILGFPAENSHFSATANGTVSRAVPFLTQRGTTNDPYFDAALHFAVKYPYPDPPNLPVDEEGRPRHLPNPAGMSGAPVWVIRDLGDRLDAKVVGIVQRHDPQQVLIVARGSIVQEFLRQVDRDFANL
jgi:hypothetical protein